MKLVGCAVNNCRLDGWVSQSNTFIKDDEACSGADSVTANKRQSSWSCLLVFDVFIAEKVEQSDLKGSHE